MEEIMVVKTTSEIRNIVKEWKKQGLTVGLVPTMGYLHEGHQSLIKAAAEQNDRVVVSVFVNPIQFGANEDLATYPRDLDMDKKKSKEAGAHVIFNPEVEEMYPEEILTYVNVEKLDRGLCGAKREGHFRGVCTVVSKLFNIVKADRAYFGKKDAQQLAIIKKMVKDLNFDIEVIACDIVREEDGLAKSSRNTYLSTEERKSALVLSNTLKLMEAKLKAGEKDAKALVEFAIDKIEEEKLAKVDYIEVVDAKSLGKVEQVENDVLIAMAVFIGKTRLIDNLTFEV
jgi:pantoate--beta-alanine ligase